MWSKKNNQVNHFRSLPPKSTLDKFNLFALLHLVIADQTFSGTRLDNLFQKRLQFQT